MLSVDARVDVVESQLCAGGLACPVCAGRLRPWGHACWRELRSGPERVGVRPRRSRCGLCLRTHVLLPVFALLRRLDLVDVIGRALERKASGWGHRRIADEVGVRETTAREWVRRFARRAEAIRSHFTSVALALDASLHRAEPAGSGVADAVEAVGLSARAASRLFGDRTLTFPDLTIPVCADDAITMLHAGVEAWSTGLRSLDSADFQQPRIGPPWEGHDTQPFARVALGATTELIHHGAEIALLRDLYRARDGKR